MIYSTQYKTLLTQLCIDLGVSEQVRDETLALEFDHEDLLLRIHPHPERPLLLMDVAILHADSQADALIHSQRLDTLMRLNGLTRITHGSVASLSPDGELMLSTALDVRASDAAEVLAAFNSIIERARALRDSWDHLGDLLRGELQPGQPGTAGMQEPALRSRL